MTAQNINLRSIIDDEVLTSHFYHGDTILDLRKRFAKEQGYDDDYENITFYQFCNELPDEKLVRELAEAEGGISYKIAPCLKVVSNEDIFVVWGTTRAEINLLTKEEEEFLHLGDKRLVLSSGFGKIGILRNKYVVLTQF